MRLYPENKLLALIRCALSTTYTLLPCPVTTHEVRILLFPISKVPMWCVVNTRDKLRVCEDVVDDLSGVTIPDLILFPHPLWYGAVLRAKPLILCCVGSPWDVSQFDRVDL